MSYKTDCKNTRNGKNKIMNQIEPIDESMFYVKFCKINYQFYPLKIDVENELLVHVVFTNHSFFIGWLKHG